MKLNIKSLLKHFKSYKFYGTILRHSNMKDDVVLL